MRAIHFFGKMYKENHSKTILVSRVVLYAICIGVFFCSPRETNAQSNTRAVKDNPSKNNKIFDSNSSPSTNWILEDWRWTHFTTLSGLPSNDIQNIVETSDSTLWVTAGSKLCWFDGFQWITVDSSYGLPVYSHGGINSTFNNELIVGISLPGGNSQLYVGNKSGFSELKTNLKGIQSAVGLDSGAFLVSSDFSLYLYDRGVVRPYPSVDDVTRGKMIGLRRTTNGTVWLNVESGLYRLDGKAWKLMLPSGMLPIIIDQLAENKNGSGIIQFEVPFEKAGLWEWTSSSRPKRSTTESADQVATLDIGPHDEAIVVYRSGDIRWRESGIWSSLTSLESRLQDITVVKFKTNGDLLFGTRAGIYLFRRSPTIWDFIVHPPPDPRNTVNEILKAKDGSFWIASSGGVEHRSANGSYHYYERILNQPIHGVTALADDSAGNIWIGNGSVFTGAYRFDGSRWEYVHLGGDSEFVFVHKIRKDRNGRLWFLGLGKLHSDREEPGAFQYVNGSFVRWRVQDGLINGRVYDFAEGPDGSYWFATNGGISRWKPLTLAKVGNLRKVTDGTWTHWTTSNGLQYNRISSIAVDQNNNCWFASSFPPGPAAAYGVGCIDTLGNIQYYSMKEGVVDNNVWDVKVDSVGRLWVSTVNGLGCYDHGTWLSYGKRTGLSFANLWPILPLGDKIYVGTKGRGVAILDLAVAFSPFPKIVIEQPFIEKFSAHHGWRILTYWGEVDPLDALTRYRIDGGEWSSWRIKNGVVLNNLEAGDHTIEVQAKNLYGAFNEVGERATFTIPLPLYRHPLFLVTVSVVVLTILALVTVSLLRKRQYDIAIRASEERYRSVVESAPNAIVMVDQHGKIALVNSKVEEYFGYTRNELIGESIELLVPQQYRSKHRNHQTMYLAAPAARQMSGRDLSARRKNGTEFPVEIGLNPVATKEGNMVLCSVVDITERKLHEDEIMRQQQQLRSLTSELIQTQTRERKRLATYLHDSIGQVLSVGKMKVDAMIAALSGLHHRDVQPSVPASRNEDVLNNLNDLSNLIKSSIKDTRAMTFELSPPILYDLGLVAAIDWLVGEMQKQHRIEATFRNQRAKFVIADEVRDILFEGTREILMNVIKYARAGRVDVTVDKENSSIVVSVKDNGVGFDIRTMEEQSIERKSFGLYNLRVRLNNVGGRVDITSEAGKGTCVRLIAPLKQ